ncbi:helix-turn-helix domain-containing protein [Patulibacter defluvii]|uniref:helix-turn-helix domain-containing protein n=1 Tax=Patulibacter defluvii TaxID=3095358 RepID=UPI002A7486D0|nr:helix-turn-helix domain-containing protein [Patulibacter sp. DM4]
MSRALLRGLALLETLGDEPIGVRELARRLDVDKGALSRTLAALADDGWTIRDARGYRLGPRARALGASAEQRAVGDRAARIARTLTERTGLNGYVLLLAGSGVLLLAATTGVHVPSGRGWRMRDEVWATAGGIALLAQLPEDEVARFVDQDPWPLVGPAGPRDAGEVLEAVARARAGETACERRWTSIDNACLARPWPALGADVPAALAVGGFVEDVDHRRPELERLLDLAVAPGTTRSALAAADASAPVRRTA